MEQVLRPAAANLRFSDCPPEHTDEIAQSLAHIRFYMQQMGVDRRLHFIRQITDLAHDEVVQERKQQEDREREDRERQDGEKLHEAEMERREMEEQEREMEDRRREEWESAHEDLMLGPETYDIINL